MPSYTNVTSDWTRHRPTKSAAPTVASRARLEERRLVRLRGTAEHIAVAIGSGRGRPDRPGQLCRGRHRPDRQTIGSGCPGTGAAGTCDGGAGYPDKGAAAGDGRCPRSGAGGSGRLLGWAPVRLDQQANAQRPDEGHPLGVVEDLGPEGGDHRASEAWHSSSIDRAHSLSQKPAAADLGESNHGWGLQPLPGATRQRDV